MNDKSTLKSRFFCLDIGGKLTPFLKTFGLIIYLPILILFLVLFHPRHYSKAVNRNPLARRLLFYILLCSSFVTMLTTALQLYFDYRSEISSIEKRIYHLGTSYYLAMAQSLWTVDKKQVNNILKGMKMFSDIQYLEVRIENKLFAKRGLKKDSNTIHKKFELEYVHLDEKYVGVNS